VEKAYARARELCRQVGETPQLFHVLLGLWAFYLVRAEYKTARALGEQLFTLAQSTQDPVLLVWAHVALGESLYYVGEFALARAHMEQGIAFYDPQKHRSPYGVQDPGVSCLSYAARVLWLLGYPDQALKRSHEALTLAHELSSPFNLAHALDFAAMFHQLRREGQATQELAEKAITLSTEQGFQLWLTLGTNLRGWALAEQGQKEEGIKQMCQGLSALRATGAELGQPLRLALLAEAHGKAGQAEEGLSALDEALAMADKNGERAYEAELYRLKGELLLRMGEWERGRMGENEKVTHSPTLPLTRSSPEECFQKAIEIARRQSAKSWELRAVMSLSRLWQQQGKRGEARKLLAEIYGWFTEGFDTADLQEAKALLEELSSM
jgi:predicted ATPase